MSFLNANTKPILEQLERLVLNEVKTQLSRQGHKATGKGLNSLDAKVKGLGNDFLLEVIGEDYLIYQDSGRKAGTMPPIDALAQWVQTKGIESDPKKVRGVAFAIANNMKRIGMHSKNKRLDLSKRNFLGNAAKNFLPRMDKILFQAFEKNFDLVVDKFVKQIR